MGSRARSPSAFSAPWWGLQPTGPLPDKRLAPEKPDDPDMEVAPILEDTPENPTEAASMLVLGAGYSLKVALEDVDLVLEPEPTSVLQVCIGEHTLLLVPEALMGAGAHYSLQPCALLDSLREVVAFEQGPSTGFPESESRPLEQARREDEGRVELLEPWTEPEEMCEVELGPWASGCVASPDLQHLQHLQHWPGVPTPSPRRSPYFSLNLHLETFCSSPLQPLPPSPTPRSPERPQDRPLGPHRKARRRLFPE